MDAELVAKLRARHQKHVQERNKQINLQNVSYKDLDLHVLQCISWIRSALLTMRDTEELTWDDIEVDLQLVSEKLRGFDPNQVFKPFARFCSAYDSAVEHFESGEYNDFAADKHFERLRLCLSRAVGTLDFLRLLSTSAKQKMLAIIRTKDISFSLEDEIKYVYNDGTYTTESHRLEALENKTDESSIL